MGTFLYFIFCVAIGAILALLSEAIEHRVKNGKPFAWQLLYFSWAIMTICIAASCRITMVTEKEIRADYDAEIEELRHTVDSLKATNAPQIDTTFVFKPAEEE